MKQLKNWNRADGLIRLGAWLAASAAFAACPLEKGAEGAKGATTGKPGAVATPAPPPVPVSAADAVQKPLPVELRAIGAVEAYSTVMIKTEVTAPLLKAHFTEGQEVKKGDLLFTLDARQFELEVASAEAEARKEDAELKNAQADAARFQQLIEKKVVSQLEFDKAMTQANSLKASVQADRARVDLARLNVDRCSIRSPISGRTGSVTVNPGNLVKANDDVPLVIINQVEPIYVTFAVPEVHLSEIKKRQGEGTLKVAAVIPGDETAPVEGELVFIDSSVNAATGTIRMKAAFPNKDRRLWPGQYVKAILTLSVQEGAIVVPAQAIQPSQKGPLVFVINAANTVEIRPVKPGLTVGTETAIEEGVKAGEHVVTDGHLRLFPGAKVEIKAAAGTATPKPAEPVQ